MEAKTFRLGLSSSRVAPHKGQVKSEGKLDILSHVGQQVLKDYFLKDTPPCYKERRNLKLWKMYSKPGNKDFKFHWLCCTEAMLHTLPFASSTSEVVIEFSIQK